MSKVLTKSYSVIIPPLNNLNHLGYKISHRRSTSNPEDLPLGTFVLTPHTPPGDREPIDILKDNIVNRINTILSN